jgi:hypothetical protein
VALIAPAASSLTGSVGGVASGLWMISSFVFWKKVFPPVDSFFRSYYKDNNLFFSPKKSAKFQSIGGKLP